MQNLHNKVSAEERDAARVGRRSITDPPEYEPGMDNSDLFDGFDDGFGEDGGFGGSDGFNNGFNNGVGGSSPNSFGVGGMGGTQNMGQSGLWGQNNGVGGFNQTSQQPNESVEDKFFGVVKKFFIGFGTWGKHLLASFKSFDKAARLVFGRNLIFTSVVTLIVSIVLLFVLPSWGKYLLIGSGFTLASGVVIFMFTYDKLKSNGELEKAMNESVVNQESGTTDNGDFSDDDFSDDFEDSGMDNEDDMLDDLSFDEPIDLPQVSQVTVPDEPVSKEEVLQSIDIDRGMVTRQYLFEKITQILPSVNSDFDKVTIIDENSEDFDTWDALIRQTAELLKPSGQQEDMPYLISAKEKLFYISLEVHRVKWLKNIDQFVEELAKICRYDEDTGVEDKTIFGIGTAVGMKIHIKIMKGETAMVTIKDTYAQVKDFILDTKHYMPVVWGLDSEGKVLVTDLKDINAMCVAGMPRSGKTWSVQAILTQMMFYLKPSELQIYIFDPKDGTSDFKSMKMPHIRKFVAKDEEIIEGLRDIVNVEAARRTKLLSDAECVNIWDYKKKCPNVELPLLYVVIDEVITFAERMKDKNPEMAREFQSLLLQFVSRLPNLGIRLFMVPHMIKDQILKKSITDMIPCRASVKGTPQHIESTIGVKEKDFPYKLTHVGDMALKLDDFPEPLFVHNAVLSSSNAGNVDIFEFLTQLWLKIEPESYEGSLLQQNEIQEREELARQKLGLSDAVESFRPRKPINMNTNGSVPVRKATKLNDEDLNDEFQLWED